MGYRINEFATMAGVTVLALRHHDRLGLLEPARSAGGQRLYVDADLERLAQIVALKYVGLPLGQIKHVLERRAPLAELDAAGKSSPTGVPGSIVPFERSIW